MPVHGLRFPSNQDAPASTAVAFKFDNPQSNGLPIWGPGGAGVTYIWEVEYRDPGHIGYYTLFFWGNKGTFLWDAGSPNTYYGAHPYPLGGSTDPRHVWEISIEGGDETFNDDGVRVNLIYGKRWRQALRVNGSTKEVKFYLDLPSTAAKDIITANPAAGYGNTDPPTPAVYFGDAPWSIGNERLCGTLGPVKIIATLLSEADTLAESADMTQLVTPAARTNNWWSKKTFASVDDLTDDYGSGRSFAWVNSNKATRVLWSGNAEQRVLHVAQH